jgi:hypothetical protein
MKSLLTVLAAFLICIPAWADSTITHIELIPLKPGANSQENLLPGRDGAIVQGWRPNGPHGYNVYMTLLDGKVVGIKSHDHFLDTMRDYPHDGGDAISSVRFARAKMDGQSVTLIITATRNLEAGQKPIDAATVYYDIYQLVSNGEIGTTGDYFAPLSETPSEKKYCNSDLALTKKFGFPLPAPYEGRNQDDGC